MPTVSFIVPCRNKERNVGQTVDSVLAQSYSPMEIVLSVQPSHDATLEIVRDRAARYDGPNEVRVLECPDGEFTGMAGLNAHLNWLHEQIAGDIVIMCAADDLNHPDRAKHTIAAFEEFNPSYVGTRVRYVDANMQPLGETAFPERRSRWIGAAEAFRHLIGSSASSAWARELYDEHGPLKGIEAQDMILPPLALCERGLYYVDLPLHTYVAHADLDNAGLEGQVRAARDEIERAQLTEVNNFHNAHHWTTVARRLEQAGYMGKLDDAARMELTKRIISSAELWANVREIITMQRVAPAGMKV